VDVVAVAVVAAAGPVVVAVCVVAALSCC